MAYSDYGGYAYRNGKRVIERSDYTLTPDGIGFESPGMWPGFGAILHGMSGDEAKGIASYPHGHAVLGDGPIFVVLYKQSDVSVYRRFERLNPELLLDQSTDRDALFRSWTDDKGVTSRYMDGTGMADKTGEFRARFVADEHTIDVVWVLDDNYYLYAQLTQPDGVIWHGWSGYGVGAGLDDSQYGFSSDQCDERLWRLFDRPPAGDP